MAMLKAMILTRSLLMRPVYDGEAGQVGGSAPTGNVTAGGGGVSAPSGGSSGSVGGVNAGQSVGDAIRGAAAAAGISDTGGGLGQTQGNPFANQTPNQPATQLQPTPLQPGQVQGGQQHQVAQPVTQEQYQALQRQYQQAQQWAMYGYQQYQQANAPQPAAAATPATPAAPAKPANPFGIPEFDRGLEQFLQVNPSTGEVEAKPFAPPDALYQYKRYEAAVQNAQREFWRDPAKFILPMIQDVVTKQATEAATQTFQSQQSQIGAQQYVQQNEGWIFASNGGQPVTDMFGRRQLTPAGQMFVQTVKDLEAGGIKEYAQQQRLAEQIVLGHYALARVNQGQAAQVQANQGRQNMLQQGQTQQQFAGPQTPASVAPAGPPQQPQQMPINASNIAQTIMQQATAAGLMGQQQHGLFA